MSAAARRRGGLTRGADFDAAVLAISLGAYQELNGADRGMCRELAARSPKLADFIAKIGIVPSQSVQLWCDPATAQLGWNSGKAATVSGPEYLNIWADMSQVIAFESWSAPAPRSLHYLTGTYGTLLYREPSTNADVPKRAQDEIHAQAIAWLNGKATALWPLAHAGNGFDWSVLRAASGTEGQARFDCQFWRANIDPTECCTSAAAGTTKYRLHPHESGFDNLFLAGEGTRHGFNSSTFEGAVMSGAAASRAICGEPAVVIGYDFLQRKPSDGPGS